MITLDKILKSLRVSSIIPSDLEQIVSNPDRLTLVSLSDTKRRTFGEYKKYYDLSEFRSSLKCSDVIATDRIVFWDYSWSHLHENERVKLIESILPRVIVIAKPNVGNDLMQYLLRLDVLNLFLFVSYHQVGETMYISYTGYSVNDFQQLSHINTCVKFSDIEGRSILDNPLYSLQNIDTDSDDGIISYYVYSRGEML